MNSLLSRRGMTMAELLVVVSVIVVLAAMLLVVVDGAYTQAMRLNCQHNMEQIGQACLMYAAGNLGQFLPAYTDDFTGAGVRPWYEFLAERYVGDSEVLGCPLSDIDPTTGEAGRDPGIPSEDYEGLLKTLRWLRDNDRTTTDADGARGWLGRDYANGGGTTRNTAVTGVVLCAFLGFGATDQHTEFGETVTEAIKYLLNKLDENDPKFSGSMYTQGMCTMAVCDALALMGDRSYQINGKTMSLRSAAQAGLDRVVQVQQSTSYGGFGYAGSGTDNSIASWNHQAIISAKRAGLTPSSCTWEEVLAKSEKWFELSICVNQRKCPNVDCPYALSHEGALWTGDGAAYSVCPHCGGPLNVVPDDYRTMYQSKTSGGPHTFKSATRLSAGALACRLFYGHRPESGAIEYSPDWNCYNQLQWLHGQIDDYFYSEPDIEDLVIGYGWSSCGDWDIWTVYYTTLSMYKVGGDYWTDWKNTGVEVLKNHRKPDGYWPAKCVNYYGRVCWYGGDSEYYKAYPTALACMAWEVSVADLLPGSKWCRSGAHSYGYNKRIGLDRRTPAADTIVLMDYLRWGIDGDDPDIYIVPRHGGRVNVLFADGHVEAVAPEELLDSSRKLRSDMLSVEADSAK